MKKLLFIISLLVFALPLSASAAIVQVQVKHQYVAVSGTAYAFGSNNTAGNFIVVSVSGNTGTSPLVVTDTQGNSYTALTLSTISSNVAQMSYAANIKGGANSIKVTSADTDLGFTAVEYSGIAKSNPLDVEATPRGATIVGPAFASNSFSPHAGSLIFAAWSNETSNPGTMTGTNMTVFQTDTGHYDSQGNNLSASAGSQTVTFTAGNTFTSNTIVLAAAFLPAASIPLGISKFIIYLGTIIKSMTIIK